MLSNPQQIHANPLSGFMRQPKIYIRLPSGGEFWPAGSLEQTETGEFPVFSMTAKDELMLKIPDAIMSGQAVVDVVQHCMPNIKNAWAIPSIDLDVILIAIRLATYGEKMTTPITFGDDLEMEYSVDLKQVMDTLMYQIKWDPIVPINEDLTIFVRPMTYKQLSDSAVKTFETQKILQIANNNEMSEADKVAAFKESFSKLTDVTIGVVEKSIFKIDSSNGSTENLKHIKEFIENADKDIFNIVQTHLDALKSINELKPVTVTVTDEMREKGITGDTVDVPLVFDPATFFV
jgi:hypothetical protein